MRSPPCARILARRRAAASLMLAGVRLCVVGLSVKKSFSDARPLNQPGSKAGTYSLHNHNATHNNRNDKDDNHRLT